MAEGAVSDWSAIHLSRSLDAGPGVAAAGLAAFSLTMAFGRLAGDDLAERLGPGALTRAGGLLAAAGLLGALAASSPLVAIAGFAAMGAGLAAVYPLALGSAGRRPRRPAGPRDRSGVRDRLLRVPGRATADRVSIGVGGPPGRPCSGDRALPAGRAACPGGGVGAPAGSCPGAPLSSGLLRSD